VDVPLVGGQLRTASPLVVRMAAGEGHTAAVEALLEAGARPHAGETDGPLHGSLYTATEQGDTAAVSALLEGVARPEAGSSYLSGLFPAVSPLEATEGSERSNGATREALCAAMYGE
jgi:hypothetical protein